MYARGGVNVRELYATNPGRGVLIFRFRYYTSYIFLSNKSGAPISGLRWSQRECSRCLPSTDVRNVWGFASKIPICRNVK
jgi:hypothetical protein